MSFAKPYKKPQINGFSMYRRQILLELRQQRKPINEEEVNELTALKWKNLSDEEKEQWKAKAKEDKMLERSNRFASANPSLAAPSESLPLPVVGDFAPPPIRQQAAPSLQQKQKESLPSFIFRAHPPAGGETSDRPPTFPLPTPLASAAGGGCFNATSGANRSAARCAGRGRRDTEKAPNNQESYLKAIENLELRQHPEKRRQKLRKELLTSLTWKYDCAKEKLRNSSFYILSCQPIGTDQLAHMVPAEICCSELTVGGGLRNFFCATIKPPDSLIPLKELIDQWGTFSHGLTFDQLQETGLTCDEVARKLLDMVKNRERPSSCSRVRFFVLASKFDQTFDCLQQIFNNSGMDNEKKQLDRDAHFACVDDLFQSLFKFFHVDYSCAWVPDDGRLYNSDNPIDLTAVLKSFGSLDGGLFGGWSERCPVHTKMLDTRGGGVQSTVCCFLTHMILAEMLRSAELMTRLDLSYVQSFAAKFIANPNSPPVTGSLGSELPPVPVVMSAAANAADTSYCVTLQGGVKNDVAGTAAGSPFADERPNFPTDHQHWTDLSCNIQPPVVPENVERYLQVADDQGQQLAAASNVVATALMMDTTDNTSIVQLPTTVVPNTSAVQHLLPVGRRGLGRGMHLTPEGALLRALRTNVSL